MAFKTPKCIYRTDSIVIQRLRIILWGQMYCVGYKGYIPEAEEVLLEEGLNFKAHRLHYAHKGISNSHVKMTMAKF